MTEIKDDLENKLNDKVISAVKSFAGMVPYVGTGLGEILSYVIPNQRMDRVVKYLRAINEKVEELTDDIKNNKEKITLIETGLKSSANSTFDEKCKWIANIVIQGLTNNIEISIADNIINIVSELNYEQIIMLYYHVVYYGKHWEEKSKFTNKFKELLDFGKLLSSDRERFNILKSKEQVNNIKLINLGLIENDFEIEKLSELQIMGSKLERDIENLRDQLYELNENIIKYLKPDRYKMTNLGILVIKTMKLNEDELG